MTVDTVVIIDDQLEILGLLRELLEDEGYQVVAVGEPTIDRAIAGQEPSLFLIDLMLSGVSGSALAEQLRAGTRSRTPFIAMSAPRAMVRWAVPSGWFTDTLQKPFEVEYLLACLAQHLSGPQVGVGGMSPLAEERTPP